ncbi:hypothetical protein Sps_02741 [Shewanella psychrophila]|uniref:Uncharacterized protein n=1 Tax=Shewanella psychrophila TaxID=225848 RepID=A0A1S6HQU4_9GAMM|nr:hypothetical protein [Shewanella psychrophila]AQS37893.1 hypothetical protein Sps_02741 [Shewanella psychrophila]
MKRLSKTEKIQPHWWQKSLAASVLGLTLAYAIIAIFAWFGPGGIDAPMKVQFNMWMVSLLWMPILAFSFMFKTGLKTLIYLGYANISAYLLFASLKWLSA